MKKHTAPTLAAILLLLANLKAARKGREKKYRA